MAEAAADVDPGSHVAPTWTLNLHEEAGGRGGGIQPTADEKERKNEECRFLVNHAKLRCPTTPLSTQQTILWRHPASWICRRGRPHKMPSTVRPSSSSENPGNREPKNREYQRQTNFIRLTNRQRVRLIKKRQYSNKCESIENERTRRR